MPTLNQDISFLKFYKTLNEAIVNEMPPITKLPESRFIQQLPNETFKQTTNCDTGVGFIGDFTAELVTCDGSVFQDITSNFYYDQTLVNGVNQIAFEFGNTGIDEPAKVFYLKLTDTTNDDVWFSYPFMITSYKQEITTKIEYGSTVRKFGIPYDLLPYRQSIRIANMYRNNPVNKKEVTQYVVSDGHQVNFDSRPTFLKRFLVSKIDDFINDRLDIAFSHEFVYIKEYGAKNIRAMVSDFKVSERQGDTNWLKDSEFTVNYQNEYLVDSYEIYEPLRVVNRIVAHQSVWTPDTIAYTAFYLYFDRNVTIEIGALAYLYKDGVLYDTITTPSALQANDNILFLEFNISSLPVEDIENGRYSIVTPNVNDASGVDVWTGFTLNEWYFDVTTGEFESTEFSEEFLIN